MGLFSGKKSKSDRVADAQDFTATAAARVERQRNRGRLSSRERAEIESAVDTAMANYREGFTDRRGRR